jgi:hypothetical protein
MSNRPSRATPHLPKPQNTFTKLHQCRPQILNQSLPVAEPELHIWEKQAPSLPPTPKIK